MDGGQSFFHATHSNEENFQLARASAEKEDADGTCCLVFCFPGCEKNESLVVELLKGASDLGRSLALCHLVGNRKLKLEQRTISSMSFAGLHVSASDEIFSELEMLVERHASDGFCGGDVIFF